MLDFISGSNEPANDVPHPAADRTAGVTNRSWAEGRVTLRHINDATEVLKVCAASLEGGGGREGDGEGEERIVDVEVGARVRGVVFEHGDAVGA